MFIFFLIIFCIQFLRFMQQKKHEEQEDLKYEQEQLKLKRLTKELEQHAGTTSLTRSQKESTISKFRPVLEKRRMCAFFFAGLPQVLGRLRVLRVKTCTLRVMCKRVILIEKCVGLRVRNP